MHPLHGFYQNYGFSPTKEQSVGCSFVLRKIFPQKTSPEIPKEFFTTPFFGVHMRATQRGLDSHMIVW